MGRVKRQGSGFRGRCVILEKPHGRVRPSTGRHEVVEGGGHSEGQEERRQTWEGMDHSVGRVTRSGIMGRKPGKVVWGHIMGVCISWSVPQGI